MKRIPKKVLAAMICVFACLLVLGLPASKACDHVQAISSCYNVAPVYTQAIVATPIVAAIVNPYTPSIVAPIQVQSYHAPIQTIQAQAYVAPVQVQAVQAQAYVAPVRVVQAVQVQQQYVQAVKVQAVVQKVKVQAVQAYPSRQRQGILGRLFNRGASASINIR